MKKPILMLILSFSLVFIVTSCKEEKKEIEHHKEVEMKESDAADKADIAMNYAYQCPMDCENGKTYSEEGICPKCEMGLKKVEVKDPRADDHKGHNH